MKDVEAKVLEVKTSLVAISLVSLICFCGCTKSELSGEKRWGRSLVPPTAAETITAPGYKLEYTTKSGIQCYVHPLSKQLADSLTVDSPENRFLMGGSERYFVIPVRDGNIVTLSPVDTIEVSQFLSTRPKK